MKLEELFGDLLEVAPSELSDASGPANLRSWDSLTHINIITGLEEVYGVRFTTREIESLKDVGVARRLLREKGVAI